MANEVKLGISGSELTLAPTLTLSLPVEVGKKVDSAVMSDGNTRYAFFADQRRWQLSWVTLTAAQLADLITLRGYNQTLRFQNNYESATYYTVVITGLSYDVINPGEAVTYYTAQMSLEQTV